MLILAVAGAIVGIAALQGLFNYLKEFFLSATSQRVAFSVRRALFAHMQRLSLTFHDRQRTGDMITRVTSDVTKVQELVTDKLLVDGISSVLQFVGMLTVMFVIDWRIGLIAIGVGTARRDRLHVLPAPHQGRGAPRAGREREILLP